MIETNLEIKWCEQCVPKCSGRRTRHVVDSRTTGMLTCLEVDVGWCVDVSLGRLLLLDGALPHFRIANHFERSVQIRIASARPQRLRRLLLFCLFQ
jgi:hypothetical protein